MSGAAQSLGGAVLGGVTKEEELLKREEELKRKENEWERTEERRREEKQRREEEWKKREDFIYRSMQFMETMLVMSTQGVRKAKSKATPLNMSDVTASEVGTSDLDPASFPKVIDWLNRQHPHPSLSVSGYGTESVKGSHIGKTSLMDQICHISGDAAKALHVAEITKDSEIQSLTREDLNELLPGVKNLKLRNIISERIKTSLQSREKHSDEHMRADFSPNPDSEESVKEQFKDFLQAFDKRLESVYSSQNAALEGCHTMFKKIQASQPQSGTVNDTQAEGKSTSRWPLSKRLSKGGPSSSATKDHDKPSKQMKRAAVVKVHCVVSGKTLGSHLALLQRLKDQRGLELQETRNPDTCDVIILLCPIVSRMGTDIEAAMKQVPGAGNKAIIRVLLHHTFDREYTVPHVSSDSRVMFNVSALFHDTQRGLLQCEINTQAVQKIWDTLLKYSRNNS